MRYDKIELCVVNEADVWMVDKNGDDWLLWDVNDDTFAIGYGYAGESSDKYGFAEWKFSGIKVFDTKLDAMSEWVRGATHADQ